MRRSHIALIRPPGSSSRHAYSVGVVPPLGLAYVGAALEAVGHRVTAIDALALAPVRRWQSPHPDLVAYGLTIEETIARVPPDIDGIGITIMFSQAWPLVEALIAALHRARPDVPIFIGGEHVTGTWEYVLNVSPGVAVCVLGEGEETAVDVAAWLSGEKDLAEIPGIAYRRDGVPVITPARERMRDLTAIPRPAWHLFPMEAYLAGGYAYGVNRGRSMPILATRGCPYQCTFCSSPQMWTLRYVERPVEDVVDEIVENQRRYRISNVDFHDLTAILKPDWILAFCAELERRDVRITYQLPSGTRSEALTRDVLIAMKRTGCRNVTYAPESGSLRVLKDIKKRVNPERLLESVRTAAELGICVKVNLIIGFPGETREEMLETVRYGFRAVRAGAEDVGLLPYCPYPGSELFEQLQQEQKLPPLSNDFFATLGYMDLTKTRAILTSVSGSDLRTTAGVFMALYYLLGYGRRPGRILRTARNMLTGRSDSVLEQRVIEMLWRTAGNFRGPVPEANVPPPLVVPSPSMGPAPFEPAVPPAGLRSRSSAGSMAAQGSSR